MEDLTGLQALVIGGTRGIGAEICRLFADHGVNVIIHGGSETDESRKLYEEIKQKVTCKIIIQQFDSPLSQSMLGSELRQAIQSADILCLCFGPFIQKSLIDMTSTDWNMLADFNFTLTGIIISSIIPFMIKRGGGRILLMGGTRTDIVRGYKTTAAYGAIKTAISSLAKSIAGLYAKDNIQCNVLLPGFTKTEYISVANEKIMIDKMPQKRLITTREVAETAIFLLQQPMINGALLSIDGGWSPEF